MLKSYMDRNYSEEINLEKASRIVGLEKKYFSAYFRKRTGVCFKDWVAQFRVEKAMAMMQEHNFSITEIAFDVGFHDLRTFERSFKKRTGMTPRAYKISVRPA